MSVPEMSEEACHLIAQHMNPVAFKEIDEKKAKADDKLSIDYAVERLTRGDIVAGTMSNDRFGLRKKGFEGVYLGSKNRNLLLEPRPKGTDQMSIPYGAILELYKCEKLYAAGRNQ